jgi:phosphoglycerate dehydrogenase-like enzyme
MLQGIGANVIYSARTEQIVPGAKLVSLRDLFANADVVSLHVPLTPQTTGMIDENALNSMKRGAILVNTARGGLVDYAALQRALANGHLRGAGLDVFDTEPVTAPHPLLQLPNVVVTPHVAWLTAETLGRSLRVFEENCRRLRDGDTLLHRIL